MKKPKKIFLATSLLFFSVVGLLVLDWDKHDNSFLNLVKESVLKQANAQAPLPDLIVTAVSVPVNPIVNTSQTFTATITNLGTVSTEIDFNNFFQVAIDVDDEGTITDLAPSLMSALAADTSDTATSPPYTFTSAGTYYVRTCADKTDRNSVDPASGAVITESNDDNNCGPIWKSVTVLAAPAPDLTASAPNPNIATVGVGQTFTAGIRNIGTISTGIDFNNFFQVATAAGGGGTITDLAPSLMSALPDGWTNTATSPSYTFTSAGTYSVRVCADKTDRNSVDPASGAVITESDENNNCSPVWKSVTVWPAATVGITANNLSGSVNIPWGESADLRWSYSDATSCFLDPAIASIVVPPDSGSGGPTPTGPLYATRLYTISCNPGGTNSTVTVTVPPQPKNLVVVKAGQGTVTGISNPPQTNVNCGSTCQAEYESGTVIVLTETPNTGRLFTGWSGVVCSEGNQRSSTCTFTVIDDLTITADFAAIPSYIEF